MNVLEEVESEVNNLKQTDPVRKEIEGLGFKIKEISCYKWDITADFRGYSISVLTDEICLLPKHMKAILNISGLNWITAHRSCMTIELWRKEI